MVLIASTTEAQKVVKSTVLQNYGGEALYFNGRKTPVFSGQRPADDNPAILLDSNEYKAFLASNDPKKEFDSAYDEKLMSDVPADIKVQRALLAYNEQLVEDDILKDTLGWWDRFVINRIFPMAGYEIVKHQATLRNYLFWIDLVGYQKTLDGFRKAYWRFCTYAEGQKRAESFNDMQAVDYALKKRIEGQKSNQNYAAEEDQPSEKDLSKIKQFFINYSVPEDLRSQKSIQTTFSYKTADKQEKDKKVFTYNIPLYTFDYISKNPGDGKSLMEIYYKQCAAIDKKQKEADVKQQRERWHQGYGQHHFRMQSDLGGDAKLIPLVNKSSQ